MEHLLSREYERNNNDSTVSPLHDGSWLLMPELMERRKEVGIKRESAFSFPFVYTSLTLLLWDQDNFAENYYGSEFHCFLYTFHFFPS